MSKNFANRLILGHMPLIGVSYQSRELDLEYFDKFSDKSQIKRIVSAALRFGITSFAAATSNASGLSTLHLQVLEEVYTEGVEIEIFPCLSIPLKLNGKDLNAYRRWSTYLEIEKKLYPEAPQRILYDPILNFREKWKSSLKKTKPYTENDFRDLTIDWNTVEKRLYEFRNLPVKVVEPGSETDFISMVQRFDLLGKLIDVIHENGFNDVIFGIHHAGMTIPQLDEELNGFKGYVTPLNQIGVMMLPTQKSAEAAVQNTKKEVYAIKPFAGGRVLPEKSFKYVFSFNVKACMFGAASVSEVEEDILAAKKIIIKNN